MQKLSEFLFELKENKTFLCILCFISYIAGLYALYSAFGFTVSVIFTSFIMFVLVLNFFLKPGFKVFSSLFFLSLYLIFIFGFLNAKLRYVQADDFSKIEYLKDIEITGRIEAIPKYNSISNTYKFPFKVLNAKYYDDEFLINNTTVLAVINNYNSERQLKYKDKYKLRGIISTPQDSRNPSQFDYQRFLNFKGILKIFYVDNGEYEFISSPRLSDIKEEKTALNRTKALFYCLNRKIHNIRDMAIKKHSKYVKSPNLEILGGVVFGDDAVNPPDSIKESFINSGLLHLLAASGLNVALILSMWFCAIYFLNLPYRLKISSGIFMVCLYAIMTGLPPSIVRASVMLILILIGKLIYRETNGISLIFAAGLLILIFKPEYLYDVGFQLSFLVTLGLIICVPAAAAIMDKYEKSFIEKIKNFPNFIKSILLVLSPISLCCCVIVPFIAQLWAAPLQAYYFNNFSAYSIFANIAVVPFIGIVSFLGFISTALCFIPYISDYILLPLDFILNFLIQIILNISNFFASLSHSIITVPSPSVILIITFYTCVVLFFISLKYFFKRKVLNKCLICVILLLFVQLIRIPDKSGEVIFFSVGNADNCLIKAPSNKYAMIDTGRYIYKGLSSAKTVTLEYFYDKNIREIDTLIVTHYDSDHSGGLIDLLNKVKVKNLVIPALECTSINSCSIKEYIEKNNINYIEPYTGQEFVLDKNTKLTNYVPHTNRVHSRNDFSTITLLNINEQKFLFMADAGIEPFMSVKDKLSFNIDVLKAAHHGARHTVNDDMMKILKPKYSILSTGKNTYGHPDSETEAILTKYSTTLSTDKLGAIKFKIKDDIKVYVFDSKKQRFRKLN